MGDSLAEVDGDRPAEEHPQASRSALNRLPSMRVPRLPAALLWDHNAHYHRWLLCQLPHAAGSALDVGCGDGALAVRLAERVERVDAVDVSATMIERAREAHPAVSNVQWLQGDVLDPDLALESSGYGIVTSVSSLHHMPLEPALQRLARLTRPGGTLVIVGLYRQVTLSDHLLQALAYAANATVGAALALRGRAGKPHDEQMPVMVPSATLAEICSAARSALPGARLRRRLFWRYTLIWTRPAS
jgi:2-polyprenyl-3-methyl-5-hydroxy-6-metoxy-1,4-benzoquinol methylase